MEREVGKVVSDQYIVDERLTIKNTLLFLTKTKQPLPPTKSLKWQQQRHTFILGGEGNGTPLLYPKTPH